MPASQCGNLRRSDSLMEAVFSLHVHVREFNMPIEETRAVMKIGTLCRATII